MHLDLSQAAPVLAFTRSARIAGVGVLPLLLLVASLSAQSARQIAKASAKAQAEWYDRAFERPDLHPGAWEVVRPDTGYEVPPPYEREGKRLLDADFYCTRCILEGRLPAVDPASRQDVRLCQNSEERVLRFIREELEVRRFTYIEDARFKFFCDLPGMKTRRDRNPFLVQELEELARIFPRISKRTTTLNDHQRAHLYLIRAHRLLRDIQWFLHADGEKFAKRFPKLDPNTMGMYDKQEVFVWTRKKHHLRFVEWGIGATVAVEGICWHHLRDRAMFLSMHSDRQRDPCVANWFAHRLAHNFLDAYRIYTFKLPAWLQIGLGHWVERRENTLYNTFCFSEGMLPKVIKRPRWMPDVKKAVRKGDVPPFVEWCDRTEYSAFQPQDHRVMWSMFCYLLSLGPEKLGPFVDEMKSKKNEEPVAQAQVRAFKKVYGLSLLQFDAGWRKWVLAVYPEL